MRSNERTRKKHLKAAGWSLDREERRPDGWRLRLHRPDGEEAFVEGPTRPKAYLRAARLLSGRAA